MVATEAAERAGLELPSIPASTRTALEAVLPDFASPSNPTDMSGMFTEKEEIFKNSLQAFQTAPEFDAVVLVLTAQPPDFSLVLADRMLEVDRRGGPLVCLWIAGKMVQPAQDRLRQGGMLVFDDPDRLMRALRARAEAGAALPEAVAPAPVALPRVPRRRPRRRGRPSSTRRSRRSVRPGCRSPRRCSAGRSRRHARPQMPFGGPVVVKAAARDLLHKAAVGGVVVGVEGADAVAEAWERVTAAARAAGAAVEGAVVQRLAGERHRADRRRPPRPALRPGARVRRRWDGRRGARAGDPPHAAARRGRGR